jgi:hypothetical protein
MIRGYLLIVKGISYGGRDIYLNFGTQSLIVFGPGGAYYRVSHETRVFTPVEQDSERRNGKRHATGASVA